ncbi:hypothetical protein GINT2_000229 [Glugoides intestinalis]
MSYSSIAEDEQIIELLEEIDENFSAIKTTLRDLKIKFGNVAGKNREIVDDCKPWINFFEVQTKSAFSPLSDLQLNSLGYTQLAQSPDNLKYSSPKNPFVEMESSELLNKCIFKDIKTDSPSFSSTTLCIDKENSENPKAKEQCDSEDTEYDIKPFERELIPEIFQEEHDLIDLYNFILSRGSVSVENILEKFSEVQPEKLEILISFLCRKRFVKQKNASITVEK